MDHVRCLPPRGSVRGRLRHQRRVGPWLPADARGHRAALDGAAAARAEELMPRGKAQKSLDLIEAAYEILEEIQPATVRAVCYRLFIAGLIQHMGKNETNKVSTQ